MKMNFTKLSLIISLIFTTLFLTNCEKTSEPTTLIITSEAKIKAPLAAGSYEVKIGADKDWTASLRDINGAVPTWITAEPLKGGPGNHTITLKVFKNTETRRFAELVIKTSTTQAVARLDQAGIPQTAVTEFIGDFSDITNPDEAYENENWTITSSDPSVGWLTATFSDGSKYLQLKGYKTTSDQVVALAKTPPFNVKGATHKFLTFALAIYFIEGAANDTKVEVIASTDYDDVDEPTWEVVQDVSVAPTSLDVRNHKNKFEIDLSTKLSAKYANEERLHIAIRYTGKAITYRLYDVMFGLAPEVVPDPVNKTIAEIRALAVEDALGEKIKQNYIVKGIVISNNHSEHTDGGNMHKQSIVIQDTRTINSGITIRAKGAHNFKLGEEISVSTFNGTLTKWNDMLQLNVDADDMIERVTAASEPAAEALRQTITVDQLETGNYQSMSIAIDAVQIDAAFFGKAFYSGETEDGGNKGSVKASTTKEFTIYTSEDAQFASTVVPEGKGMLKGIASVNKYTDAAAIFQVLPQRPSDFAGLTR